MTDQVRQLGSVFNYVAGAPTVIGSAPAKCTAGSLSAGQGKVIGRWTLPDDPGLSTVSGYFRLVSEGDPVVFPAGASPDETLGKVGKWAIEDAPVGQLVDAWVVSRDKYGVPLAPGPLNALYLGRSKVTATRKSNIAGASFT